jgi:hypothetical protein
MTVTRAYGVCGVAEALAEGMGDGEAQLAHTSSTCRGDACSSPTWVGPTPMVSRRAPGASTS